MEQAATPLKLVLGLLSVAIVGVLGFLLLQAARPSVKNPQPLAGATAPRGEVTVGADVTGEADLKEVRLRLDGKPVQPVIVAHSQRRWSVSYQVVLARGPHEAVLTAVDQRGRTQTYQWRFTASGPASPPKFANPLPRPGARVAAGEALVSLATFSDGEPIASLALHLNGQTLVTASGRPAANERTVASQRQPLSPGSYMVHATATTTTGETASYDWQFSIVTPDRADARFFPETGFYVFAPFAAYWTAHGGLPILGLPITADFEQQGVTIQYFERARLERHPELPPENQVILGLLGSELRAPDPPLSGPPASNRRFFPQTGHSIGGRFGDFWERNGGLARFGLPLTEEITEDGLTVQWFERARFEYHPEAAGTPAEVQLTQLGRRLWERGGKR